MLQTKSEIPCAAAEIPAATNPRITVDEFQAAEAIGVSVYFLRKDRRTKRCIPFYRLGDRILYNLDRVRDALTSLEEGGGHIRGRKVS